MSEYDAILDTAAMKALWCSSTDPSDDDLFRYFLTSLHNTRIDCSLPVLIVGEGPLFCRILTSLQGRLVVSCTAQGNIRELINKHAPKVVLIAYTDPESVHAALRTLHESGKLGDIQFIYKINQKRTYAAFHQYDRVSARGFIESNFQYRLFEDIFRESLQLFEHHTEVRDALDFTYYLDKVAHVEGDIIELGSYKGHSGFILSRFQEKVCQRLRLGPHKTIFLCDTFAGFPHEDMAIDKVWNDTHNVSFDAVRAKFSGVSNVEFVKGDIRQTLGPLLSDKRLSFVFVDLDSFAATQFALETVYPRVNSGGVVVCQDYGKEHCAGARLAIDNFVSANNCLNIFSFFSGMKMIFKMG